MTRVAFADLQNASNWQAKFFSGAQIYTCNPCKFVALLVQTLTLTGVVLEGYVHLNRVGGDS